MDPLSEVWRRVVATQPTPPAAVVAGTAVVAALLVLFPRTWRVTRHAVTIVHEGAHGVAALLTGRRLSGIRLHSDTSGVTVSVRRPRGPGMVLTTAAGYAGPALLGVAAAALLGTGHAIALLWAVLLLLALLLAQIRNWFGLWSVLACGGVVLAVTELLPGKAQSAFAYLLTWFLLLSAPRPVLELSAERRRRRSSTTDADQLARLTGVPGLVWVWLFLAVAVGGLLLGSRWLVSGLG